MHLRRVVAKFDHYCYMLGNSVGELNHGRFYRMVFAQLISIWTGYWLIHHAYLSFHSSIAWTIANGTPPPQPTLRPSARVPPVKL